MRSQVAGVKFQVWSAALLFTVYYSLLTLFCGCGKAPDNSSEADMPGKLSVCTVNYPLQYFAERIGGDLVDVQFPGPADEDPAYWAPGIEAVSAYQEADLVILNGADYAKWISKVSLPPSRLVDTSVNFKDQLIELKGHTTHSHGPDGKHAHGGYAFTTWLDPKLAIAQARAVKDALLTKLPESKVTLTGRFVELETDLLKIDKQLEDVFSEIAKRPLVFSHPVYQYMESRYGLNGRSLHWEPGEAPTEEMWTELKVLLREHPAKWMVWEGIPDAKTVAKLKEFGVGAIVFDPCGTTPDTGDYLTVMRQNVVALGGVQSGE